jgi:hypothetical protein
MLTESDRLNNLEKRGNAIKESFQREFDKIKRLDEEKELQQITIPDKTEASRTEFNHHTQIKHTDGTEKNVPKKNKSIDETQFNQTGDIEIKAREDNRGGRTQKFYTVYYNGDDIYSFTNESFGKSSLKQVAQQIFDTYNIEKYTMELDTAINIAKQIFQKVGRSDESGEEVFPR